LIRLPVTTLLKRSGRRHLLKVLPKQPFVRVKVADHTPQIDERATSVRRYTGVGYPFSTKNTAILGILGMVKNAKNTEKTSVCREMWVCPGLLKSPLLYRLSYILKWLCDKDLRRLTVTS
jgi:hypothetical protein